MIFILSKLLWLVVRPSGLLVVFALAGLAVRRLHWLLVFSVALLTIILLIPVDQYLLEPLEDRFPTPAPPRHVDGIIVLGGALDTVVATERNRPSLNAAAERMTEVIPLTRAYPDARLVFTGGSGELIEGTQSEADTARMFWRQTGMPTNQISYESKSRSTRENAVLSKAMIDPKPGEIWLLVTSASHMPRSVGVFRAVGWNVIAWPVAYKSTPRVDWLHQRQLGEKLQGIDWAVHEYVGLVAYHLVAWTDSWFPAP